MNNFDKITPNGVTLLLSSNYHQPITLQVLSLGHKYNNHFVCSLSDRTNQISCRLQSQCLQMANLGTFIKSSIIQVFSKDTKTFDGILELHNCRLIGRNEASFPLADASSKNRQVLIKQLLQIGDMTNLALRVKVYSKPNRITSAKPFLIVGMVDDNNDKINVCCFGEISFKIFGIFEIGVQCCITNGSLMKRKNREEMQIRILEYTQISINNTEKGKEVSKIEQGTDKARVTTVKEIMTMIEEESDPKKCDLVNIVGKVTEIEAVKQDAFAVTIVDEKLDKIEVMLWKQVKFKVEIGRVYEFSNLKIKCYRDRVSLNSFFFRTQISQSELEINMNSQKVVTQQVQLSNFIGKQAQLPTISLGELKSLKLEGTSQIRYVLAYLDIDINPKYLEEKNFFFIRCEGCGSRNIDKTSNICSICSSNAIIIKLNIRVDLLDNQTEFKATLNEEIAEKFLRWTSKIAFRKFIESKQEFLSRINQIRMIQKVFKVKVNQIQQQKIYYNVWNAYEINLSMEIHKLKTQILQQF